MKNWTFQCDVCGRFIPLKDFIKGRAKRELISDDTDYSTEDYETLCKIHKEKNPLTTHEKG